VDLILWTMVRVLSYIKKFDFAGVCIIDNN